jgi:hypothetical protein
LDQLIIANTRLKLLQRYGLAEQRDPHFTVPDIECATRGYLVQDTGDELLPVAVLLSLSEDIELVERLAYAFDETATYEYWLLTDSQAEPFDIHPEPGYLLDDEELYGGAFFSKEAHMFAITYLMGIFAPSRAPFSLLGLVPYELGQGQPAEQLFAMTERIDSPPATSPVTLWQQFRQAQPDGRYWVAIRSMRPPELSPNAVVFLDSLLFDLLESLEDDEGYQEVLQAALNDGFYDDPDQMLPYVREWVTNTNTTFLPPYDFDEIIEILEDISDEQVVGRTALFHLFRPSQLPFRLLGFIEYHPEDEEREDLEELLATMIPYGRSNPASSPQELFAEFRLRYPEGRYWLVIQPNATDLFTGGQDRQPGQAFVVDSDLLEIGLSSLGEQSFHDAWRDAEADGLISDLDQEDIPGPFQEALEPDSAPGTSGLLEGLVFCGEDGLPMIVVEGDYVCAGEYLLSRLGTARVSGIISEPALSLVFSNGCRLPLLCPGCGDSLHIDSSEDEVLQKMIGLNLVDVSWDEDDECLVLGFSSSGEDAGPVMAVHLDSAARLSCPGK